MFKIKCLPTLSYTFQCFKQIHAIPYVRNEMFNAPSQQRISSMAVENLPVFNSVSKDKLMNIATQVHSSYYLFSDILIPFFVTFFWKGTRLDRQSEELLNKKFTCSQYLKLFWHGGPTLSSFLCWLYLISAFVANKRNRQSSRILYEILIK